MIGSTPEIKLVDPLMGKFKATISLSMEDESCEFESKKEIEKFIKELQKLIPKAYQPRYE